MLRTLAYAAAIALSLLVTPASAQFAAPMLPTGGGGLTVGGPISGTCPNGDVLYSNNGALGCEVVAGTGTVTNVSWTGGIVSIANPTTVPAFTIAGTSGGIPYFASSSTWAPSATLAANALVIGGGAGAAPSTTTTGLNVLTALGAAINASTGLPNIDGSITTGHCLEWGPGVQDAGAACGSGGSTSPGGTPGQIQYNNSGSFGGLSTVPLAQMPTVVVVPSYVTGQSSFVPNLYMTSAAATSSTGVTNNYYCAPFPVYQTVTIKGLAIRIVATSTGNSSAALQGAIYNDVVGTSSSIHQPGTLIDYTANFATGVATSVAAAMNNTTDILTGPGMYWECLQRFDATATYAAFNDGSAGMLPAVIGANTIAGALGGTQISGLFLAGSAYGGANWANFPASTTWSQASGQNAGPYMAIEVN